MAIIEPNYGVDISAYPDLSFKRIEGRTNLLEAILRRFLTPRGGLLYDETYGLDLRQYVQEELTNAIKYELEVLVIAECVKDERVKDATFTLEQLEAEKFRIHIGLIDDNGTDYRLVLNINAVTVEVLYAETL